MFTRKPRLRLGKIVISSAKRLLQHNRHKADNPVAPAFVRFWTIADIAGFWREMAWSLMTHKRHWLCTAAMVLMPVSAPIKVLN
jgi:hypothetical protein